MTIFIKTDPPCGHQSFGSLCFEYPQPPSLLHLADSYLSLRNPFEHLSPIHTRSQRPFLWAPKAPTHLLSPLQQYVICLPNSLFPSLDCELLNACFVFHLTFSQQLIECLVSRRCSLWNMAFITFDSVSQISLLCIFYSFKIYITPTMVWN